MPSQRWIEHAYPLKQITVQAQGTRHSDLKDVAGQLRQIADLIDAGNLTGWNDDDDFGYCFTVETDKAESIFPIADKTQMMQGMTELEKRAHDILHQAFCRLRYFAKRPLNEAGRDHLFLVADAAHNIPDALAGNVFHRENLERDVLALEDLLSEPYGVAEGRYRAPQMPQFSLIQRFRIAVGI